MTITVLRIEQDIEALNEFYNDFSQRAIEIEDVVTSMEALIDKTGALLSVRGHLDFMASINNMLLPAQRKYSDSIPDFSLPPIVQRFAAGGQVQSAERNVRDVVEIKLSLGGESVSGEFPAEDATYNLIQELKRAGLTNG